MTDPRPMSDELTDAEIVEIRDEHLPSQGDRFDCIAFARSILQAARAAPAQPVAAMVDRFLSWPLPKDFAPDCGISFDGRKDDEWNKGKTWPIGTNLFTAEQARAMFEHAFDSGRRSVEAERGVPREPTEVMINAGIDAEVAHAGRTSFKMGRARAVWYAMHDAHTKSAQSQAEPK